MPDAVARRWRIRPATPADAADLGRLHIEGWRQGYRGLVPDRYLDSLDEARAVARWQSELSRPSGLHVLLAEDEDGRALGFASVGPCLDPDADCGEWEIWDTWVAAGARGHGIGSDLLLTALELAPLDIDVVVWVLDANVGGQRFYERHGAVADDVFRTTRRPGGVQIRDGRMRWPRASHDPR